MAMQTSGKTGIWIKWFLKPTANNPPNSFSSKCHKHTYFDRNVLLNWEPCHIPQYSNSKFLSYNHNFVDVFLSSFFVVAKSRISAYLAVKSTSNHFTKLPLCQKNKSQQSPKPVCSYSIHLWHVYAVKEISTSNQYAWLCRVCPLLIQNIYPLTFFFRLFLKIVDSST